MTSTPRTRETRPAGDSSAVPRPGASQRGVPAQEPAYEALLGAFFPPQPPTGRPAHQARAEEGRRGHGDARPAPPAARSPPSTAAPRTEPAGDLLPRSDRIAFPAEGEALLVQDGDGAPPPSPRRRAGRESPAGSLPWSSSHEDVGAWPSTMTCFSAAGRPRWISGERTRLQRRRHRRRGFDPCVGKIPWRRAWRPPPVLPPGESHGQRSLVGLQPTGSQRVGHNYTHTSKEKFYSSPRKRSHATRKD